MYHVFRYGVRTQTDVSLTIYCVLFMVHFTNEYKSVSHFQTIHTFDKNGSAADAKAPWICSS